MEGGGPGDRGGEEGECLSDCARDCDPDQWWPCLHAAERQARVPERPEGGEGGGAGAAESCSSHSVTTVSSPTEGKLTLQNNVTY